MTVLKEELVVTGDTPRTWLWNIVCAYERWWYEQTNGKQLTHSYYTKEYVREFCEWQYLLTRFEMMLSGGVVRVLRPAITHRCVNVGGIRVRMPKG